MDSSGNRGPATLAEEIVMDAEKSVMESFEFLNDGSGEKLSIKQNDMLGSGFPDPFKMSRRELCLNIFATCLHNKHPKFQ